MKFLIAGLGSIGRRHLRNLVALGEEDIVLYRTGTSTLLGEELSGFPTELTLEDALAHAPDAVILSNPTSKHLDVAIPAAQAGCSLLIEKPISNNLDKVQDLKSIIRENGNQVLVGYQFRFHPVLQTIKKFIDGEKLGNIFHVRSHWGEFLPDWHPWEDFRDSYAAREDLGGGVVLTLSHPIDYLIWFFGHAVSVWGWTDQRSDWGLDVEDTADFYLKHDTGVVSNVHLNYLERPGTHNLTISGTKGSVHWRNEDGSGVHIDISSGLETPISVPDQFERNDLFLAEIKHFIDITRGHSQPICTLEEGIHVLQVALSIKDYAGFDDTD